MVEVGSCVDVKPAGTTQPSGNLPQGKSRDIVAGFLNGKGRPSGSKRGSHNHTAENHATRHNRRLPKVLKKVQDALETFTAVLGLLWILAFGLDELSAWLKENLGGLL